MNASQADKIIELLERIADTQDKLLDEQRQSDREMREAMASLPFGQDEGEDEKKSTEAYYKQGLVQTAAERFETTANPWSS